MGLGDAPDTMEGWMRAQAQQAQLQARRPSVDPAWQRISRTEVGGTTETILELPPTFDSFRVYGIVQVPSAALTLATFIDEDGVEAVTTGANYYRHIWQNATGATVNALSATFIDGISLITSSATRIERFDVTIDGAGSGLFTLIEGAVSGSQNPPTSPGHIGFTMVQTEARIFTQLRIPWGGDTAADGVAPDFGHVYVDGRPI